MKGDRHWRKLITKAKQFPITDIDKIANDSTDQSTEGDVSLSSTTSCLIPNINPKMDPDSSHVQYQCIPAIQHIKNEIALHQFENFVQSTWQYTQRVGKDAIGLRHDILKLKYVCKFNNNDSAKMYQTERTKLKRVVCNLSSSSNNMFDFNSDEPRPLLTTECIPPVLLNNDPLDTSVNEGYLFHGTKKDNVSKIASEGLKVSAGGLYGGSAVYLAESVEKADQYAGESGQMIF